MKYSRQQNQTLPLPTLFQDLGADNPSLVLDLWPIDVLAEHGHSIYDTYRQISL